MEREQTFVGDRGVVHPMHPPIADSLLVDAGKPLKAGTVLKSGASGAAPAGETDTPTYVLIEDVDTTGGPKPARCVRHGTVVKARLIDASGASEVAASNMLVVKLPAAGIYPVQDFDTTKMV
jgi:hypothetical protein